MKYILLLLLAVMTALHSANTLAKDIVKPRDIDFLHYKAELEPSVEDKSVAGRVTIEFQPLTSKVQTLQFSAQYKEIMAVTDGSKKLPFKVNGDTLNIDYPASLEPKQRHTLIVEYISKPKRGMKFYSDHLFTVYHTKNWLVSHNDVGDKASFELAIKHDKSWNSVGNGELISQVELGDKKVMSTWLEKQDIPIFTFGFALGLFNQKSIKAGNNEIKVLYRDEQVSGLSSNDIYTAFKDSADMLEFFEQKAGFGLSQKHYRYLVVDGYMAQEASGYSLVGEKFVHTLLKNKFENWFVAHELAHEWWGNSVTCANFSHFWLNEGLVQFLVAAYKERLFGEQAYKDELAVAVRRVKRAEKENRVAPVAFKHEILEQQINRTMAYSKGALVFYMLREQLGDEVFWQALKQYTLSFKGDSVTTQDLKLSFEQTSNQDLTAFFDRWVYGEAIPNLNFAP